MVRRGLGADFETILARHIESIRIVDVFGRRSNRLGNVFTKSGGSRNGVSAEIMHVGLHTLTGKLLVNSCRYVRL
jgi:hypothetical protein